MIGELMLDQAEDQRNLSYTKGTLRDIGIFTPSETSEAEATFDEISAVSVHFARIATLENVYQRGSDLTISLPFSEKSYRVERMRYVDNDINGVVIASGDLVDVDQRRKGRRYEDIVNTENRLQLSYYKGTWGGYILHDGITYIIYSVKPGIIGLYATNPTNLDDDCTPRAAEQEFHYGKSEPTFTPSSPTNSTESVCVVRVGFGVDVATSQIENVVAEAATTVADMNEALQLSGVSNLRYENAGTIILRSPSFQGFNPSSDPDAIGLASIQGSFDAMEADVDFELGNFIHQYGLDQFALIVRYRDGVGAAGWAEGGSPATRDKVIIQGRREARLTGPHELGHNHGCQHDDAAVGPAKIIGELNDWARGSSFAINNRGDRNGTVMGYAPSANSVRRKYFTHPSANAITGSVDYDNARQLRNTACYVSNLGPEPMVSTAPLTLYSTQSIYCQEEIARWGLVSNGGSIASVSWALSVGGNAYVHFATTTFPSVSHTLPYLLHGKRRDSKVRAVVTFADGNVITVEYSFYISNCQSVDPTYEEALVYKIPDTLAATVPCSAILKETTSEHVVIGLNQFVGIESIRLSDGLGRSTIVPFDVMSNDLEHPTSIRIARPSSSSITIVSIVSQCGVVSVPMLQSQR